MSRALRGDPRIRAATRDRVLQSAAELDYRPNLAARSLALGRTGNYWILLPLLYNPIIQQETLCLSRAVRACDRDLMIVLYHGETEIYNRLLNRLSMAVADGAFIVPPDHDIARTPAFDRLLRRRFPMVCIDRAPERNPIPGCPLVTSGNREAAAALTRRLIAGGARKIISLFSDGNSVERERRDGAASVPIPEHGSGGDGVGLIGSSYNSVLRNVELYRQNHPGVPLSVAVFDGWPGAVDGFAHIYSAEQDFEQISTRALELMNRRVAAPDWEPPVATVVPVAGIRSIR